MNWFSTTTAPKTHYPTTYSTPNNSPAKNQSNTPKTADQLRNADRALNHKELNIVLNDTGKSIREAIDKGR